MAQKHLITGVHEYLVKYIYSTSKGHTMHLHIVSKNELDKQAALMLTYVGLVHKHLMQKRSMAQVTVDFFLLSALILATTNILLGNTAENGE